MDKQIQISIIENGNQILGLVTLRSTSAEYTAWLASIVYNDIRSWARIRCSPVRLELIK